MPRELSRQTRWQDKMRAEGRCVQCGAPVGSRTLVTTGEVKAYARCAYCTKIANWKEARRRAERKGKK